MMCGMNTIYTAMYYDVWKPIYGINTIYYTTIYYIRTDVRKDEIELHLILSVIYISII